MEQKEIAMPPIPEEELVEQVIEPVNEEEITETQEEVVAKPVVETMQQKNFKALREEKERLERENYDVKRKIQEYENMRDQAQQPKEEDLDLNIGDDDLFEGKHYKQIQKQLKKQQEMLEQYKSQVQLTTTETRLKSQYNDFDIVVTKENIKKLREEEPELAETIASNQDVYSKAVAAYKMIKKLGIFVEDNYENDRETVKRNSLKPKPLASVSPQQGDSPLTKANAFANGLTPELKKQLWREMEESSKGY